MGVERLAQWVVICRNPKQIIAYVQVFVELPFLRFHGPRKNNRRHSATLRLSSEPPWDLRPRLPTTAAPRLNGSGS